jgi:hypothetical protein
MKIQDILRGLLDTLDNVEHTTGNPSNALDSVEGGLVPVVADNTDNTESGVMVPPLQAALELQKREAGIDSFYDEEGGCGCDQPCDCASTEDYADEAGELSDITRLAGFPQEPIVAITTSSTPF